MRRFKLLILLVFFLSFVYAKCEKDTIFYQNSFLFPLSDFINSNEDYEGFKIGFLHHFNHKIALRFFLGINLNNISTLKPINTESNMKEIKEFYFINPGIKIDLIETKDLLFYCASDFAFGYDLNKIEGSEFSSVTKTENKYKIFLGFSFGIEFFVVKRLSFSIESGISYEKKFGNKSVQMGAIVQEDELPTETNFGLKPYLNYLYISIYF